jgi:tRNA pseudouridine38-40 synthase
MAVLEYDGTEFYGFQLQKNRRTVQGEVEAALARITQRPTRVAGGGRTDAGVHAAGQVISFRSDWSRSLDVLQRALNAVLPKDVAIISLAFAPERFHARFTATSRTYRYSIHNAPIRSPLARRFAYEFMLPLDEQAMDAAAQGLVGVHDFATFGSPVEGRSRSTVREVFRAGCSRQGSYVFFDIEANAFLSKMVRGLVGTLIRVGTGELSREEFEAIWQARDRRRCAATVPACGLCLVKISYPVDL